MSSRISDGKTTMPTKISIGINSKELIERHLQHLEQARRAHAAADAHGDDDMLRAAALAFDQRMAVRRAPDMP